MIVTDDDTPASPAKSNAAMNPQSPSLEAAPPPAYGAAGRVIPQEQYQPYDAAGGSHPTRPLLPPNLTDLEASNAPRRRQSAGRRFCGAFAIALLVYVLAVILFGTFSVNIHGDRTRKQWHDNYPIPKDLAATSCTKVSEMKKTGYADRTNNYSFGTVTTSLSLPLSSETLFFLSRGALSNGVIRIAPSARLEDTEVARVDVNVRYEHFENTTDPSVLDSASVCLVQKKGIKKNVGVGMFSPQRWSAPWPYPSPRFTFDVTLVLPESRGPSLLHLNTLETDLPHFDHMFVHSLDEFVMFDKVVLKGGNGKIEVESLTTDDATIQTSNGEINIKSLKSHSTSIYTTNELIKGHFTTANSLQIKGINAKIIAEVDVVSQGEGGGKVTVETSNNAIEANIRIHDPSSLSYSRPSPSAASYTILATTQNAPINLVVAELPLDSMLNLASSSINGPVIVSLPATYEGLYTVSTTNAMSKVQVAPMEDPAGLGRRRMLGSNSPMDQGKKAPKISDQIYWDKKNREKGKVVVKSTNADVQLHL